MNDDFLKELEAELKRLQENVNIESIEDFDNLSSEDMHNIIHRPFKPECPIQYRTNIDDAVLNDIPFFNLAEYYLNSINDLKEVKLTTRGNLPTKLVKEFYGQGFIKEEMIEDGFTKLSKEQDSISIQNVKIILDLAGFVKKKHNKLSLTKGGKKRLGKEYRQEVLFLVFRTYGYDFNLAYHDGYGDESEVQRTLGYAIYLFLKYGDEERELNFYTDKILVAYPHLLDQFKESYATSEEQFRSCFKVRIIVRFLSWFNFLDIREEHIPETFSRKMFVKNLNLNKVFELKNDNFQFWKPKSFA